MVGPLQYTGSDDILKKISQEVRVCPRNYSQEEMTCQT